MNERDVLTLLAEANPIRLDGLSGAPTDLLDSILARRRRPRRRPVLAAGVAAAALAASLIGVFVFGGPSQSTQMQPGFLGIEGPVPPPPPRSIGVADLSLALGTPVALPMTSLVQPADAQSVTADRVCPAITPAIDGTCFVTVKFPSQSLTVEYNRPTGQPGPAGFAGMLRQ
jgi:hypothetical protein